MSVLSPTNFETVDYNMPNWSAIINTNWQTLNSYMAKYGIIWGGGTDDTGIKWDSASSTWIVCTITDTDIANHVASVSNPHVTKMSNLNDAVITSAASGQGLFYNGTKWVNLTLQNVPTIGIHTLKFTASGTWTVPTGITSILVNAGAGGGGGGASDASEAGGGGGGAGQTKFYEAISVTAGDVLTITIGAGGAGGVSGGAASTAGGVTSIVDSTTSTTLLSLLAGGGGGYGTIQGFIGSGSGYPAGGNGYWDSANSMAFGGGGANSIFGGGGLLTVNAELGKPGALCAGSSGAAGGTTGNNGGNGGSGIMTIQW